VIAALNCPAQDCLLDDIRSPEAATLARLSGVETASVSVAARPGPAQLVVIDPDVDPTALRTAGSVTARVLPFAPDVSRGRAGADAGRPQAG
jgi:hypothetical protein